MFIVHTSDLHLNPERPETLRTLRYILDTCKTHSAEILTIGGDLFDRARDVEVLRPRLRQEFSGNDFKIISIPGNHDIEAYTRNLDFGEDLDMITNEPFKIVPFNGVSVVAIPYRENISDELIRQLEEAVDHEKINILLLHCTLDISFTSLDFGEEEKKSYFPITSSILSKLGYDYVLAGHFHKEYYIKDLGGESKFVYPGSPLSLTWKEIGQRCVALINTDTGSISPIPLDSHYYDKLSIQVKPSKEKEALIEIQEWVDERSGKSCELMIEVFGFGNMDETWFGDMLKKVSQNANLQNHYRNVENVLTHVLFEKFKEKLEEKEDLNQKKAIADRVIEVMSEMLAERKIR